MMDIAIMKTIYKTILVLDNMLQNSTITVSKLKYTGNSTTKEAVINCIQLCRKIQKNEA